MGERRERDVDGEGGELCLLQFEDVVLASECPMKTAKVSS